MSDVQATPEQETPAPVDVEAVNQTIMPAEPVAAPADTTVLDPGHAHNIAPESVDPSTHFAFIREELDAIVFGIKSGVNNGVERALSLMRHVESLL